MTALPDVVDDGRRTMDDRRSGPRMRLLVYLNQLRRVDMCVALGRTEPRMAEQLLNGAQVRAVGKKVCCKRMPQRVRADAELCPALRHIAPHEPVDAPCREPFAAVIQEQSRPRPS